MCVLQDMETTVPYETQIFLSSNSYPFLRKRKTFLVEGKLGQTLRPGKSVGHGAPSDS